MTLFMRAAYTASRSQEPVVSWKYLFLTFSYELLA